MREHPQADPIRSSIMTTDGGTSFKTFDYESPSVEVLMAAPGGWTGRFRVLGPGANGYEDGANEIIREQELVIVGVGDCPAATLCAARVSPVGPAPTTRNSTVSLFMVSP